MKRGAERWARAGMSWLRASAPDRWSSAKLVVLWAAAEVGLRRLPLPVVCRLFRVELGRDDRAQGPLGQKTMPRDAGGNEFGASTAPAATEVAMRVRSAARQVDRVLRTARPHSACLRRSLLLGYLLRDLHPVLRIGVARSEGAFEAHAWLEVAQTPVPEPVVGDSSRSFVPLRRFRATPLRGA